MTSSRIRIRWSGGERTFADGQPVSIGRDVTSMIRLSDDRASRRHAEVRPTADGWLLVDVGSTAGLYLGSERVFEVLIKRPTIVRFGASASAEEVTFEADVTAAAVPDAGAGVTTMPPPTQGPAPSIDDAPPPAGQTVHLAGSNQRPGGRLAPNAAAGATEVVDQSLTVQFGGQTMSLYPGRSVTLGRDDAADLRTDNPTISRRHARVYAESGQWYVEDLGSSRGTFLDGKRITKQKLSGSMAFTLGPEGVGERLVTVAAGEAPRSRSRRVGGGRTAALIGAAAVAIAVLVAAVLLLSNLSGDDEIDVAALRAATVYIEAGEFSGSGSIIDGERGLILTNAHVVSPDSPGQGVLYPADAFNLPESADDVLISLSQGADEPAEPAYFAEVVAADGYLDLAVVKITRTIGGRIVEDGELDLPSVSIGDSEQLDQDDELVVFGYPGIAGTNSSNKVDGSVSGFVPDERLGDNRAWVNSDVRINRGDSGGLAADQSGQLVAVPTVKDFDEVDSISRLRPVHLAQSLIEAATNGDPYESEYVVEAGEEAIVGTIRPASDGLPFATSCRGREAEGRASSDTLSIAFDYTKFPAGHQDVLVTVVSGGRVIGQIASNDSYPVEWNEEGCAAASVPLFEATTAGQEITLYIDAGPNYERPLFEEVIVL